MQQYADMKMKMQVQAEKAKNQSTGRRVGIMISGMLALAYSGAFAYFFFQRWSNAMDLTKTEGPLGTTINKYQCITDQGRSGTVVWQEDYAPIWLGWMRATWICYSILSVIALIAIIGAWVSALRPAGGCCVCCAQIYALVCTIALTVVRFGEKGGFCVEKAGQTGLLLNGTVSEQFASDGQFLQRAVIAMWCLGCIHCCFLGSGLSPV